VLHVVYFCGDVPSLGIVIFYCCCCCIVLASVRGFVGLLFLSSVAALAKVGVVAFLGGTQKLDKDTTVGPIHTPTHTHAHHGAPHHSRDARARASWAVDRATALPEVWALVATHLGLVGAWRLTRVCKAARVGAKEFISTLPGLVVCGGRSGGRVRDVWRLDLATLRWGAMPALVTARAGHACCAVRGTLVVLGGSPPGGGVTPSVEMLSYEEGEGAFVDLPPLSCGAISSAAAIAVEESDSAAGQVLLLGGTMQGGAVSTAHLVDLATGVCTPGRPDMLRSRYLFAAAGFPDGRIVCAGGYGAGSLAEMLGPPVQGALDAAWSWRQLPAMSAGRFGSRGCVMNDGRFAVLGGSNVGGITSSRRR
jgi:hypothetical protein